ncbi:MAG: UDP binding domain-containing protein, partial [Ktedonobacterales bacterium]
MKINNDQRHVVIDSLVEEFGGVGHLRDRRIAVLGLAFKDNTDDMREAPAIDIINWLIEAGANVRVFDPVAMETAQLIQPQWQVTYCLDAYDAARGCDAVIVVTEWKQFRELNMSQLLETMRPREGGTVFIDGRNLYDPAEMARVGFAYHGIGRGMQRRNGRNNGNRNGSLAVSQRTKQAENSVPAHAVNSKLSNSVPK